MPRISPKMPSEVAVMTIVVAASVMVLTSAAGASVNSFARGARAHHHVVSPTHRGSDFGYAAPSAPPGVYPPPPPPRTGLRGPGRYGWRYDWQLYGHGY
jgi:hypothetical protein